MNEGGIKMSQNKETPEMRRERLQQEELKYPASSIHGSNLADLVGGLSWKGTGIIILLLFVVGTYFVLKFNPPLEISTIASNEDNTSVVVGIGNSGFMQINRLDVTVNNHEKPIEAKMQVSHAVQGFVVTDDFQSEETAGITFVNINEVGIATGTSPSDHFEKLDDGTASEVDEIYGISVIHDEAINQLQIKYKHFGMTFEEIVEIHF